ncbi:MAG TPA: pyridoxal-dependent decarboxylase [Candidatus Thermoplasmatota archaeon]
MGKEDREARDIPSAYRFLGADGARDEEFRRLLDLLVDDHLEWRRRFAAPGGRRRGFVPPSRRLAREVEELRGRLRGSAPFHSPYYVAHMASDVLIPGLLGYIAGMLYNQNNIASEKSPSTTPLELEVAQQLAGLIGYDRRRSWGHLTSGGTVANFEGLWAARNLKAFPFAARDLALRRHLAFRVRLPDGGSEDIRRLSPVELLNLPVPEVVRMRARLEARVPRREVVQTLASIGPAGEGLASLGDQGVTSIGAILLPGTKHYSWLKVAEALGVGRTSLRYVEVDERMRMKPGALTERVRECRDAGEAVLACVAVVGSTAEGAVDPVDEVVAVQQRESRRGTPFYIHADAAYGGYVRSMMLPAAGGAASLESARAVARAHRLEAFPEPRVARALLALPACDSVTVDPHKFGYVPVPAGAVLFREGDVRGVLATPRPYFSRGLDDWRETPPSSIGGFILEGTKPGAAAASAWLAHRVVGLNAEGYGSLVAGAVAAARELQAAVEGLDGMSVRADRSKVRLRARLLTPPDLNILCFGMKPASERKLGAMNAFNRRVFRSFEIERGGAAAGRFVLSSTRLTRPEYGDAPLAYLRAMGIARHEWNETRELFLMRAVVLSPLLAGTGIAAEFGDQLADAAARALGARRGASRGHAGRRRSTGPPKKGK